MRGWALIVSRRVVPSLSWKFDKLEFAEASEEDPMIELEPVMEIKVGDGVQIKGMLRGDDHWVIQDKSGTLFKLWYDRIDPDVSRIVPGASLGLTLCVLVCAGPPTTTRSSRCLRCTRAPSRVCRPRQRATRRSHADATAASAAGTSETVRATFFLRSFPAGWLLTCSARCSVHRSSAVFQGVQQARPLHGLVRPFSVPHLSVCTFLMACPCTK